MAEPKKASNAAPAAAARQVLRVTARRASFRRAGRVFVGSEPTDLPLDQLSAEQVAAIQAEPMLVAVLVTEPTEG